MHVQDITYFEYLNIRYPPQAGITEISGPGVRSRLAIRRKLVGGTRMDFIATADLTFPSTKSED